MEITLGQIADSINKIILEIDKNRPGFAENPDILEIYDFCESNKGIKI
jgi:hypothetical protein